LDTALVVIVATAVLHNMAIDMNEEETPPPEAIDPDELERFIALGQIQDIPFLIDHPNPVNLRNELVLILQIKIENLIEHVCSLFNATKK
jgi:hypothetical protein